jgi:hypothetical protein
MRGIEHLKVLAAELGTMRRREQFEDRDRVVGDRCLDVA